MLILEHGVYYALWCEPSSRGDRGESPYPNAGHGYRAQQHRINREAGTLIDFHGSTDLCIVMPDYFELE